VGAPIERRRAGVAVEKVVEKIAKEALAHRTFRQSIRELVQRRSRALPD
jgi:hypothetical protein